LIWVKHKVILESGRKGKVVFVIAHKYTEFESDSQVILGVGC